MSEPGKNSSNYQGQSLWLSYDHHLLINSYQSLLCATFICEKLLLKSDIKKAERKLTERKGKKNQQRERKGKGEEGGC